MSVDVHVQLCHLGVWLDTDCYGNNDEASSREKAQANVRRKKIETRTDADYYVLWKKSLSKYASTLANATRQDKE